MGEWCDQLENSLVRAESARKDVDLIVMLRLAYQICKDQVKEGGKNGK